MKREISPELHKRLAGILPASTSFTVEFIPPEYAEIDEDFRPIFTIKPWSANQIKQFSAIGKNEDKALAAIASQIVNISNLYDLSTGEEIAFESEATGGLSLAIGKLLPSKIVLSLLSELTRISGVG